MDLVKFGQDILSNQPISQLLGAELLQLEKGVAVLRLKISNEIKQQHGFAHGGVIGYLADNALYFAAASVQGDSVTSEYKINYLKPAIGELLEARAKIVATSRRQSVCQCEVFCIQGGNEVLVALAQGTILPFSES